MAHDSRNLKTNAMKLGPWKLHQRQRNQVHGRHLSDDELIKLIEVRKFSFFEEGFSWERKILGIYLIYLFIHKSLDMLYYEDM